MRGSHPNSMPLFAKKDTTYNHQMTTCRYVLYALYLSPHIGASASLFYRNTSTSYSHLIRKVVRVMAFHQETMLRACYCFGGIVQ